MHNSNLHHENIDQTLSPWMAEVATPEFPQLRENRETEICIVGAGIAGLTTAYLLGVSGKSVILLEDGEICSGETQRTTAQLVLALDQRYVELEKLHGENGAHLIAQSHVTAIEQIEQIILKENIECDFQRLDGYLFLAEGDNQEILNAELHAAHRAGLTNLVIVQSVPLNSLNSVPAIKYPMQAQFNPLKYLKALAKIILNNGGEIFSKTHVKKVVGGEIARIDTDDGFHVNSKAVVITTNSPVNDLLTIHTKQIPFRTYVIGAKVPLNSVPKALYWDTLEIYHYVRLDCEKTSGLNSEPFDLLIIGGEDHKTGQANNDEIRFANLEQWALKYFPMIEEIKFRWSGQVFEPVDGIAFIGRNPIDADNVFIASGFSGTGMTYGTIAGILISDLINKKPNSWEKVYDPSRKTLSSIKSYTVENLNAAVQYLDWVTAGDVDREDMIEPGSGAVLRSGLKKIATFRDESGEFHRCSAVCSHLGGIVRWNKLENSWDCPCHGSRFDKFGEVICGPANSNLTKIE